MEYLSDEWIAAFDRVVADHAALALASVGRRLTIEYTLSPQHPDRSGDGESPSDRSPADRTYTLVLDHGHNRCVAGRVADPDITIRTDRPTAIAIATHTESAQSAFMAGRIRLGGDVRVLIASQAVLAGIDDATAELRARTTFTPTPIEG